MLQLLDNRNAEWSRQLLKKSDGLYYAQCYSCEPSLFEEVVDSSANDTWRLLNRYQGKSVSELQNTSNGTVLAIGKSRDTGDDSSFFDLLKIENCEGASPCPESLSIATGNLMGAIRFKDKESANPLQIEIHSRFDASNDKQYFLNYLLSRVFDVDFVDLVSAGNDSMLEILLAIVFLLKLREAVPIGLFKQYQLFENNDLSFRGRLDLSRHLRSNYPICDKIAYTYRAVTFDNTVNHLLRSAITKIERKWPGMISNQAELSKYVQAVSLATPTWDYKNNRSLLQRRECSEKIQQPFFAEYYEDLRIISRLILEDDGLNLFQDSDGEVVGVVFDGAWLWEEYLARILDESGFHHSVYEVSSDHIPIFARGSNESDIDCHTLLPDFYNSRRRIVLDAKYKQDKAKREDIHQILAYLLITGATRGGLIYPPPEDATLHARKVIVAEGSDIQQYWQSFSFPRLPDSSLNAEQFVFQMHQKESEIRGDIDKFIDS